MGTFESGTGLAKERQQRGLTEDDYPNKGNHIAIFECQLKQPPIMSLMNHTHKDYLFASRLNFTKWRLVDVDNYMGGAKPFRNPDELLDDVNDPRINY